MLLFAEFQKVMIIENLLVFENNLRSTVVLQAGPNTETTARLFIVKTILYLKLLVILLGLYRLIACRFTCFKFGWLPRFDSIVRYSHSKLKSNSDYFEKFVLPIEMN